MIDRTPHFLLDGQTGWRTGSKMNLAFICGDLSLEPVPGSVRPITDSAGTFGGLQDPQGLAVDQEDRIYILDSAACLLKRFDPCSGEFTALPCIGPLGSAPRQLSSPQGLAISCGDDIYIADTGNRRVQVFSVNGLALRHIFEPLQVVRTPQGITVKRATPVLSAAGCGCELTYPLNTWEPRDLAVTGHGWLYVADYANGLIHVFDPRGCWHAAYDGQSAATPAFVKPIRITLDPVGRVYVVQSGQDYIAILDSGGMPQGTIRQPDELKGIFCPAAIAIDSSGNLCISDCFTQQVYFYRPDGDGGWCTFRCCGSANTHAPSMIFDRSGKSLLACGKRGICTISSDGAFPMSGILVTQALDSKTYRCVWDRVQMTANIPPGTAIRVDTLTAESAKEIDEVLALPENRWSTGQIHTNIESADWDCLIQGPPGRYLWLRLTLTSDGSATPQMSQAKIYYPRASSLKFLPAVYRADAVSADFLDRFLSIFDTLRRGTDGIISDLSLYFDPKATPVDFLAWLAGWLGMTLKNGWPVERRRRLLQNAHLLYRTRGTPEGLRLHIKLYSGVEPRILELFRLRRWLEVGASRLGDNTTVFGDSSMNRLQVGNHSRIGSFQLFDFGDPKLDIFNKYAYQFRVVVPRWPGAGEADRQAIEQIIEMAKPAHTVAEFQWAEPRLRIGLQAFVGVDTVIGKYPSGVIEGQGKLGYDTVIGNPQKDRGGPSMSVGGNSVIGSNSVLA